MTEPSEDKLSDANPSHDLDTIAVWSGMGPHAEMEATGIHSVLDAAGIQSIINGFSQMPTVPFEVLVSRDKLEESLRVIADAEAGGPAAADAGELEDEKSGRQPA